MPNSTKKVADESRAGAPLVAFFGFPNAGKTTLYNKLTGGSSRAVNYPGSTVECSLANATIGDRQARLLDLPGITTLHPDTADEKLAVEALFGNNPAGVPHLFVAVADATQLERHLYPAMALIEAGARVIIALTMIDILEVRKGQKVDTERIAREIGAPVVTIDARQENCAAGLLSAIGGMLAETSNGKPERPPVPSDDQIEARYKKLGPIADDSITPIRGGGPTDRKATDPLSDSIDRWLLHPLLGVVVFGAVMALLFTSIFWLAQPLMEVIDTAFSSFAAAASQALPDNWFSHLLADGLITGVGAVAVFLPQILILFLVLGFLEDSGYLARGAMIIDRLLAPAGLSGRAFVPILSGFACAIPAVLATRTIPSRRERFLTILVLPLMLCSARLPVYGLLLAFLTPPDKPWVGGLSLAGLYLFSAVAATTGAAFFGRILGYRKSERSPLILELPAIRRPKLRVVIAVTRQRVLSYVNEAGQAIIIISILLWTLTHIPYAPDSTPAEQLSISIAATLGHWLEPLMAPLGLDWRVGVALLCAFAAREVFVAALALVLMVTRDAEEPLILAMRDAQLGDGEPLFTVASCIGIIIFFVFAVQCMPTVAVTRKETGSWKIPLAQLGAFNLFAWGLAAIVVQGLRLMGIA